MKTEEQNYLNKFKELSDPIYAVSVLRFFKQSEDSYCKNDKYLGIKAPIMKDFIKENKLLLSLECLEEMIQSEYNEVRVLAWILIGKTITDNEIIKNLVIKYSYISGNWNVVDTMAPMVAKRLTEKEIDNLGKRLQKLQDLWSVRTAIVLSLHLIKNNNFTYAIAIIEKNIDRTEDMIRKPIGWMLREIGKKDKQELINFLNINYKKLSNISFSYATEHLTKEEKQLIKNKN